MVDVIDELKLLLDVKKLKIENRDFLFNVLKIVDDQLCRYCLVNLEITNHLFQCNYVNINLKENYDLGEFKSNLLIKKLLLHDL